MVRVSPKVNRGDQYTASNLQRFERLLQLSVLEKISQGRLLASEFLAVPLEVLKRTPISKTVLRVKETHVTIEFAGTEEDSKAFHKLFRFSSRFMLDFFSCWQQ